MAGKATPAETRPAPAPGQHALAARQGEPGAEYASAPLRGPVVRLAADARGVVRPASPEEVRLADDLRLPVIPDVPTEA